MGRKSMSSARQLRESRRPFVVGLAAAGFAALAYIAGGLWLPTGAINSFRQAMFLAGLLYVFGFTAWALSRSPRSGQMVVCRRCDYPLEANGANQVCSECGADLAEPASWVRGHIDRGYKL